jgi:hypothetical protein
MLPAVERAGRPATGFAIEYGETVIRDIGALAAVPSRGGHQGASSFDVELERESRLLKVAIDAALSSQQR